MNDESIPLFSHEIRSQPGCQCFLDPDSSCGHDENLYKYKYSAGLVGNFDKYLTIGKLRYTAS